MPDARRSRRIRSLALAAAVVFSACRDGGADGGGEALPLWTHEPEVRIGAVDDPAYAFGSIDGLQVDGDGNLYTLHPQEQTIRRWTADGRPAGTIGRGGEGPGEFTTPSRLGWRGDSLWVFDSRNYRVSFFMPDGTFHGNLTPRVDLGAAGAAADGGYPARPSSLLGDGSILAVTPGFSQDIVEGQLTRLAWVRMSVEGRVLDTLTLLPVGPATTLGVLQDGGGTFTRQPFGDAPVAALTENGSALLLLERSAASTAEPAEFRLTLLNLEGDTAYSRGYAYAPVPIPRERVDSAVQAISETLHGFIGERTATTLPQWIGWVGEAMYAPPYHTPVERVLPGRDGTVWLSLHPPTPGEPEWLVLDDAGEPLAKVDAPDEMNVMAADRSALWGTEQDALGVEYIVRYGLRSPP